MRDPLLVPACGIATGILLCRAAHFGTQELIYASTALCLLAIFAAWKSTRRSAVLCAAVLCLFAGLATAEYHRPGKAPQLNADPGETLLLAGCIVEPPELSPGREQFLLELAPRVRIKVNLNLRDGEQAPHLHYGQQAEVEARIRMPHNFQNPGSFDYVAYLARQQIYWTASAHASQIKILPGNCGSKFWAALYGIRVKALDRLEQLYKGNDYAVGMMQATLIGDSAKLQKVWTENFRRTGTYHALVISGLHVSVLAMTLLFLMRICFIPRMYALILAGLAAWLYVLVSGWQTPAVRSAGGITLFLIATLIYRRGRVLNVLAALAIGFLLLDPEELFDASFQLSFLAVAAIGALAAPLIERTSGPYATGLKGLTDPQRDLPLPPKTSQFRVELRLVAETISLWTRIRLTWVIHTLGILSRILFFVYELAIISTVMQIALALPMIYYFHRVSFSGVSANVFVVPLLSAAVPIGFLAIFSGWHWPAAAAGWLLNISQRVVDWHVAREPAWRVPDPPLWLALAFAASLVVMAIAWHAKPILRRASFVVVLALFALLLWQPFAPLLQPGKLELTAVDVGQGDSLLVGLPDGKTMLVDAGGIPVFGHRPKPKIDIGEDVVSPYLWSREIHRVDLMAVTHMHEDHVGGMVALLENFRPKELWIGATPEQDPAWKAIQQKAALVGTKVVRMHEGIAFALGGVQFNVLAPALDYEPTNTARNNDSLVLQLTYGKHVFLLTGDVEKQVEAHLLTEQKLGKIDVLKVAHHGSKTSSTEAFIEAIRPAFALISVGQDNLYHHPTPEVIQRLERAHAEVMRTDITGLITVRSDGHRLEVERGNSARSPGLYSPFGDAF
jgi:competence protein ComEC